MAKIRAYNTLTQKFGDIPVSLFSHPVYGENWVDASTVDVTELCCGHGTETTPIPDIPVEPEVESEESDEPITEDESEVEVDNGF